MFLSFSLHSIFKVDRNTVKAVPARCDSSREIEQHPMSTMLIALIGTLVGSLLTQFFLVAGFVSRLRHWRTTLLNNEACPKAAVVLCLRGGDPFLFRCIEGLLSQDYPDYQIRFVVDHVDDPSMPILRKAVEGIAADRYQIEVLDSPLSTCSLKCSCMVQAVEGLSDSVKIVALLDADTIPHATWLRELATAIAPENAGAATGNRWYLPTHPSQGALVRYAWNAAAIVQMYWYEIAWGGTLAIKVDSIRRAQIVEKWRLAYGDDTMIRNALASIGQKVAFAPTLMMINREDCTLGAFQGWVKRQLLSARLYHPFWLLVVGHGVSAAALIVWLFVTCLVLFAQGELFLALALLLSFLLYHVCLTSMLPWMEKAICDIARARGEAVDWPEKPSFLYLLWIAWVTQWTYTWALLNCLFMRRFVWRGVEYEVSGPWSIKMLGYRPFQIDRAAIGDAPHSI